MQTHPSTGIGFWKRNSSFLLVNVSLQNVMTTSKLVKNCTSKLCQTKGVAQKLTQNSFGYCKWARIFGRIIFAYYVCLQKKWRSHFSAERQNYKGQGKC